MIQPHGQARLKEIDACSPAATDRLAAKTTLPAIILIASTATKVARRRQRRLCHAPHLRRRRGPGVRRAREGTSRFRGRGQGARLLRRAVLIRCKVHGHSFGRNSGQGRIVLGDQWTVEDVLMMVLWRTRSVARCGPRGCKGSATVARLGSTPLLRLDPLVRLDPSPYVADLAARPGFFFLGCFGGRTFPIRRVATSVNGRLCVTLRRPLGPRQILLMKGLSGMRRAAFEHGLYPPSPQYRAPRPCAAALGRSCRGC